MDHTVMDRRYILFFLICLVSPLLAQVDQEDRVEISIDELSSEFSVTPVGEHGLIVFGETDEEAKKGENRWQFYKYSTEFDRVGRKSLGVDKKFVNQGHFFADSILYIFLSKEANSDEYKIVQINVNTFKSRSLNGAMPKKFSVKDFKIYQGFLYVSGSTSRGDVIGYANLKNKIIRIEELPYKGENTVHSVEINSAEDQVDFVITNYRKNQGIVHVHSYRDGKQISRVTVNPRGDNNLLSAKITKLDDGSTLVAGTFARTREQASGMFIAKFNAENQEFIRYYNFVDFENFFNFLPVRQQIKIAKKKARKEKQGKELKVDYKLLTHDIIEWQNKYILIAEAYFPTYRTIWRWRTVYYRGVYYRRRVPEEVFDGFQYTHGIVTAFDHRGALLWDNTFEMNDYKSNELTERIKVKTSPEKIEMAYGSASRIKTKVIQGNEVVDRKVNTVIATQQQGDKVRSSKLTNMEYWYDNYFVIWGYQKIKEQKDTNRDGKKKRKVFYFNKLRFG